MTYSAVQTDGNTQLGGVPGGAVSDAYQVGIARVTSAASAPPTSRHRPTKPTSARIG